MTSDIAGLKWWPPLVLSVDGKAVLCPGCAKAVQEVSYIFLTIDKLKNAMHANAADLNDYPLQTEDIASGEYVEICDVYTCDVNCDLKLDYHQGTHQNTRPWPISDQRPSFLHCKSFKITISCSPNAFP